MDRHIRILGILHIIGGSLWLLIAFLVMVVLGGVAGVLAFFVQDHDALLAAPIVGVIGVILMVALAIFSIPSIVAGVGLLNHRNWARILTIVLSVLYLFKIPIGTAIGVYGLWVLFSPEALPVFQPRPMSPARG